MRRIKRKSQAEGEAVSDGYQQGKAMSAFRAEQGEMLGEVDNMVRIFKRLTDHGVFDYNFVLLSGSMLDVQEQLRELKDRLGRYGLPYLLQTIPQAILDVPDGKIYAASTERKEQIEQLRQIAKGELAR